jgi:hypothetical protein
MSAKRNSKGQFVKASAVKRTVAKGATAKKAPTKSNAVMLSLETSFPTNCQRVDRNLSKDLKAKGMKSHKGLQFVMVKREVASKGRYQGQEILAPWPCFQKAVSVKNKINQLVAKRSLDMQVKGNRLLPVSQIDIFKEELNDLARELDEAKEEFKASLSSMKQEDLDRLQNSHDDNGNPVDLSSFYEDSLYPTEAKIDSYGIRKFMSRIDSDLIPDEVEETFAEAEKEKVNRLIERVSDMFVAINSYITADSKKFTENSIENVVEEAQLLKEFDLGNDNEAFNTLCDKAVEIASSVNSSAIRQARQNVDKSEDDTVVKDAKKFLDETKEELSNSFDKLKEECEGLF